MCPVELQRRLRRLAIPVGIAAVFVLLGAAGCASTKETPELNPEIEDFLSARVRFNVPRPHETARSNIVHFFSKRGVPVRRTNDGDSLYVVTQFVPEPYATSSWRRHRTAYLVAIGPDERNAACSNVELIWLVQSRRVGTQSWRTRDADLSYRPWDLDSITQWLSRERCPSRGE